MKASIERLRAAVTAATMGKGVVCPGARIEELFGEEIARYPERIMSLDVLPKVEGFDFIGYDVEFNELKLRVPADCELVGWRTLTEAEADDLIRAAKERAEDMAEPAVQTSYRHADAYRGIPFCNGRHGPEWCKDPFCYHRR